MENKRQSLRIPYREAVQFLTPGQSEPEACLACDLSEGGIRLNSFKFIPLHEKMALTLQVDTGNPIDVQGRVVWVQRVPHSEYYQVGLVFDPPPANEALEELQEYIQSR